ncbi:MAG: Gfo/Idh/MocA family oxidoreductase, partial [Kiritimatiellae bacterium]|nr:Gfo/Idh/MocA family oxidoreductase [Kiritimatiellia bacterium]
MIKHPGLDAVVISTPNFVHAEQAIAFLEAGKHLMLEKPMGINRNECDRIIEVQQRSGKNFTVDFEMRVSPYAKRLKSLIDSGELGELKHIEFIHHRGCWLEEGNGKWRVRPEKSGGLFFMEPIHEVDIFRFFGGEIKSVQSTARPNVLPQYRFEDNVYSHFFFESGAMATLITSHSHSAVPTKTGQWSDSAEYMLSMGHDMSMIFTLTGGSIAVNFLTLEIMINRFEEWPAGSGGVRVIHVRTENLRNTGYDFFHDIDAMRWEFIRRCANGLPPVQDPLDIWKSHITCLAAEQSLKEDFRRINIDYTLPKGLRKVKRTGKKSKKESCS